MIDFDIQRSTRRCFATEREFQPGETIYSVLCQEGSDVVRRDYCAEAWQGPPDAALGWWKSQLPGAGIKKKHWAPNDVMLHYFEQLAEQPEKADVRYLLALLMIRRRVLRQEAIEASAEGQEQLVLFCSRNEQEYRTAVALPAHERISEIQAEFARLLYEA